MRRLFVALCLLASCDRVFDLDRDPTDARPIDAGEPDTVDAAHGCTDGFSTIDVLGVGHPAAGLAPSVTASGQPTLTVVGGAPSEIVVFAAVLGVFGPGTRTPAPVTDLYTDVAFGAFDTDAIDDRAVLVNSTNTRVDFQLTTGTETPVGAGIAPHHLVALDIDDNGFVDLSWLTADALQVVTHTTNGFGNVATVPVSQPTAFAYARFEAGGSRRPVVISKSRKAVETIGGAGVSAIYGDAPVDVASARETASRQWVVVATEANQLELYLIENETILHLSPVAAPLGVRRVQLADIDRDGRVDIVVAGEEELVVLQQENDQSFVPVARASLPEAAVELAVSDFSLDGLPDVALLGTAGNVYALRTCR